ncbi:60S ribosomal protein L28-1 [Glycine soja]|uniref:60S ribosomal protein L28-1 n=1 Tax=Glycine soja TaxID=3848 RepID=A0A445F025_GLYSO|nr:60S ribosomal protein L28-1 [Glycine soja]
MSSIPQHRLLESVADNYYRPDLKKAALARLSAVNRSLRVAKSGVKKRNRQAVKLPILHYYHPFPPFVVCSRNASKDYLKKVDSSYVATQLRYNTGPSFSIDEEDPRPTSSNGTYIMWYQEHVHLGVEERIPEFQEPMDLRSNPFQGGEGMMQSYPPRALDRRL